MSQRLPSASCAVVALKIVADGNNGSVFFPPANERQLDNLCHKARAAAFKRKNKTEGKKKKKNGKKEKKNPPLKQELNPNFTGILQTPVFLMFCPSPFWETLGFVELIR